MQKMDKKAHLNHSDLDVLRLLFNLQKSESITGLGSDGGAYRIRTGDLYNANVARYQLC